MSSHRRLPLWARSAIQHRHTASPGPAERCQYDTTRWPCDTRLVLDSESVGAALVADFVYAYANAPLAGQPAGLDSAEQGAALFQIWLRATAWLGVVAQRPASGLPGLPTEPAYAAARYDAPADPLPRAHPCHGAVGRLLAWVVNAPDLAVLDELMDALQTTVAAIRRRSVMLAESLPDDV